MTTSLTRDLERLTHSGIELSDPAADLRGLDVRDRTGEDVGTVADVLVDPEVREVRMLEVEAAGGLLGLGRKHHLVPLEALAGKDSRTVFVNAEREQILDTPVYEPAEGDEEEAQYLASYHAYGLAPYWEQQIPA
jgi:sporulation protein YlmC with PRC-barrel domain